LDDSGEKLTGTDGVALDSMEVKVIDSNGDSCPPNQEGDLLSRGPALSVGYLKNLEGTLSEYQDDWFFTGDRAVMDEDGYIRISGRNKDIIIRGGENVPVAYVENVLYEHEDILDAQLIALPDPRLQEKACAVISMKPERLPLTFPLLQEFLKQKGVAKQYWPEYLEIVENFPRTASGKIQKFRLKEKILQRLSEQKLNS
ncbi:MAG TPA: cyclohexanecarboxylate-CoA ligase, partial [Bacillus sp. (in: firmicutes)]|nr:cyclohexanecarboxylate-CoA ligase [Bacillus sp. (in: firmicutes)]